MKTFNNITVSIFIFITLLGAILNQAKAQESLLIHYWYFDENLPNNLPLESVAPSFEFVKGSLLEYHSAFDGYPFDSSHPNWRKASLERRNAPTPLNYRPEGNNNNIYDQFAMRGIQVKQPFYDTNSGMENIMIFHLPTDGFENIKFGFAALDEGAANNLLIDYSVNPITETWITTGLSTTSLELTDTYQIHEIDFSAISDVNKNSSFKIRIRFEGNDMTLDQENRVSFNNISLDGTPTDEVNYPPIVENPLELHKAIAQGNNIIINLNDVFIDLEDDELHFTAISSRPLIANTTVNGNMLTVTPLQQGDAVINLTASDGVNESIPTKFRVMVYPMAFHFNGGSYTFNNWAANQPEYSFPPNMIFLQSEVPDPGLNTPLLHPYHIPENDYHEEDIGNIGFAYQNTRRTRINGLGKYGIAFINTGCDRDLGGALLALNTQDMDNLHLNWTAQTLVQNIRVYAIRLQYRIGINGEFQDLLIDGHPIEYLVNNDGHMLEMDAVKLPAHLMQQQYLQLLWRYYYIEGESGARPQIRLDNINVSPFLSTGPENKPNIQIYSYENNVIVEHANNSLLNVGIYNLVGQKVKSRTLSFSGRHVINTQLKPGIYVVKLESINGMINQKVILR